MRVFNWDHKLVRFAEQERGRSYEWGETDCASLVRRAMDIMYGEDKFPNAPNWTTEVGAKRALGKIDNVNQCIIDIGGEDVHKNFRRNGDIVTGIDNNENFPGMGVVVDVEVLTSSPEYGVYLARLNNMNVDKVFRV